MELTSEQKTNALKYAMEITTNFSQTGSIKCTPDEVLKDVYNQLVEICEAAEIDPFVVAVEP
jgi:hypothetical protein